SIDRLKLASLNFRDAGFLYEITDMHKKAAELLQQAAQLAKISGSPETALECYRASLNNYKILENKEKMKEIIKELDTLLSNLIKEEEKEENYHVAASYLFELGNNYDYLKKKNAENYFRAAANNLIKAIEIAIEEKQNTIAAYSFSCFVVINLILNDIKSIELKIEKFRDKLGKINYFKFSEDLKNYFSDKNKVISEVLEKYNKILKHSDELDYLITKLKEII
ncbi:MAG: hypothetical protein ACTSR3_05260, partial [Candidatus Helarchaeota archaeon]